MSDTRHLPRTTRRGGSMSRREFVTSVAASGALLFVARRAAAAAMRAPSGPIEVVVGSSAGGTVDTHMRRLVDILGTKERIVTVPMVVQNRPGGSWQVGMNYTLGKAGDEHVVLAMAQPILTTPIVRGSPPAYDKFTPLGMFLQGQLLLVVRADSPYKDLRALVEAARRRPKEIKVGGAQTGSTDHLVTGKVRKATGADITYVGFGGGGEAQAAFLGGNVDVVVLNPDEALPHVESGRVRMIALLSERRMADPRMKDVPTAREQGFDVLWSQQWGLLGPPGLAPEVVAWWDDVLGRMVESRSWKAMIAENLLGGDYLDSKAMKGFLVRSYEEHLAVLRDLGLAKQ